MTDKDVKEIFGKSIWDMTTSEKERIMAYKFRTQEEIDDIAVKAGASVEAYMRWCREKDMDITAYALAEVWCIESGFDRDDVYLYIDDIEGTYDLTDMDTCIDLCHIIVRSAYVQKHGDLVMFTQTAEL